MGRLGEDFAERDAELTHDSADLGARRRPIDARDVDRAGARRSGSSRSSRACSRMRGLDRPRRRRRFLKPSLDQLHDPSLLAGLPEAVGAHRAGRSRTGERIAIHGDYDVDGITSTVILRRTLELLGGNVGHFIPERLNDGYGLQPATIDRLHAEGVQAGHLGRLRHPRRGRGAPRARARAST